MSKRGFIAEIEGYAQTAQEAEIVKKYGLDYRNQKGRKAEIISRLHPDKVALKVSDIIEESAGCRTLRLTSAGGTLPPFLAGQYINLFVAIGGIRTSRPYSISSSPGQNAYWDITVRRIPEGFVSDYLLDTVKKGDLMESSGPAGHLYYNPLFHGQDLVFLAGGSGVTPFMSMIREVTDRGLDRQIHLIYGCRTEADILFGEELRDRAARYQQLTCSVVLSEPAERFDGHTGFIDGRLLTDILGDLSGKTFYLCGPQAMYAFCHDELRGLGVPEKRIRREVFGKSEDITRQAGWPAGIGKETACSVSITGDRFGGREITARAGEPLLVALERAGIPVESSCRSGECSLCRVKLLAGTVYQPPEAKVRASDRAYGYIHSCAAYPVSDLTVMI